MINPTFTADWRHVFVPVLLTSLVVGTALAFAFS
jgi:ABC-type spermidine/putrescine transport system permease subunit II